MNEVAGVHPGYRAAHAKGTVCSGTFTSTPHARELSRAAHLQGDTVRATVRFSNGSGNPEAPDASRRDGRGVATKFHLPDGEVTDIVAISIPVWFVRTPEDFLDFVRARVPDQETGEPDMEKLGAFVGAHPETQKAFELVLPTLIPPVSYATSVYNSLHAFRFLDGDGDGRFGRYRWLPEAGEATLSEEEIESASRDYLQEEIRERLAREPVAFTLTVKLAAEGDPLDDPTVTWPDDRETVELGRLEVTEAIEEPADPPLVFDPMRLTDGIEASDDKILHARPHAYSVSIERRTGA